MTHHPSLIILSNVVVIKAFPKRKTWLNRSMPFRLRVSLAILLGLLTLIFVGPFVTPVRPLENMVSASSLADETSQFIKLNGVDIHYKTAGDPNSEQSFILLHGFGSSVYTWHELMPALAKLGFVIAFDRPAFGLTERLLREDWGEDNPYTPEAQLAFIDALMNAFNLSQTILVGHSAGGAIAAEFALENPEKVSQLILLDATLYSNGSVPAWSKFILYSPQFNRIGPLLMRQFSGKPGTEFLESSWYSPAAIDEQTRTAYKEPLSIIDWDKALWELSRASKEPKLANRLQELSTATLVISGENDNIVPLRFSEQAAKDLANANFASIADCGHVPQEECPQETQRTILEWLAKQGLN